ncbi:MAG TPA: NAD(P)H-binding protein [Alphaproteobacteria bacterium]|nr:NAD(P)H-binding protein [Alphaproteobacteria bacterium]
MTIALVIGATGLVGRALVRLLVDDPRFDRVHVFARRPTNIAHSKLQEHIVDFERLDDDVKDAIRGDVLFSALGTTRREAGSAKAQYRVDHDYQLDFAGRAARNGVPVFVLISSAGASVKSPSFYMRMKGEIERDAAALPFRHLHILRPGYLAGQRERARPAEALALAPLKLANALGVFRAYRPIAARTVGAAMIAAAFDHSSRQVIHEPGQLFALGGER